MDVIIAVCHETTWDIIPEYVLYFESFCLQIPEKAESLEDATLYDCVQCGCTFSSEFVTTEYRNFSYWDGGVDIVEICDACCCGAICGVNPKEWY